MKKLLTIIISCFIILTLSVSVSAAATTHRPFTDVTKTSWYYNDVYNSYSNGIFKGTSSHEFSPKTAVTRGMFVTVLYRAAGSEDITYSEIPFSDVDADTYYADAVMWSAENKVVEGYPDGTFHPEAKITREEAAAVLHRYSELFRTDEAIATPDFSGFADKELLSEWAEEAMAWANQQGFIKGREDKDSIYLAPQDPLTRAEAAAIINRYEVAYNNLEMADFSDTIDYDALASYDNTSTDYWFGKNYDSLNRPTEPLRFQEDEGTAHNALAIDNTTTDKVIYLTFDEGYENGYTDNILDVLKSRNVKAVFFITGYYYKTSEDLVSRMINEGHIVGNHSSSHPAKGMPSLSLQSQYNDINTLQNSLRSDYDYEMTLFRYPAGIYSDQSLALMDAMHMKTIFWSYAYGDYDVNNQPSESTALTNLKNRLHPGAVYLLHAVSSTNTAILGDFIDYARSQGYTFELVVN